MTIENFGCKVFNESVMKKYLTEDVFRRMQEIRKGSIPMDAAIAHDVAAAMKDWAIEKGATHYTHWFQPMTGITAEKHDAFLDRDREGNPILEFSSRELIKGEPDASSFPSGGMRATFEARGYTVWDPTSDAFIKENTLCIPTAFCSYTGAVLDKKTPLLRSIDTLNRQCLRLLQLLGDDSEYIYPTVGCEQEYFLINKEDFARRPDLIVTGRTLFGNVTPKGQMLNDHYYGTLRPRVKKFMEKLDEELWQYGIYSKTEHNEAAPAQHEMACIYTRANVAADQNQIVMEVMKKMADEMGFVCLLNEKPFEGIAGSGKHNNWSLANDKGENLLKPGRHPEKNLRFLLLLAAVVRAVDDYQDLLRISVATAGNDHRLGGDEAPPAILSMFLGTELTDIIDSIISGQNYEAPEAESLSTHIKSLPNVKQDNTDRNRTSPFAFTGNKFEFRMAGSSINISCENYIINTIVAESLRVFADTLEKAGKDNIEAAVQKLLRNCFTEHRRIIFNGNSYSREWREEAERRGLLNLRTAPEAYAHYDDAKNVRLFEEHGILSREEIEARKIIGITEYVKLITIEANTFIAMTNSEIIPASARYAGKLAESIRNRQELGFDCRADLETLGVIHESLSTLHDNNKELEKYIGRVPETVSEAGAYVRAHILPLMETERSAVNRLEALVDKRIWPYPDYTDILFYV